MNPDQSSHPEPTNEPVTASENTQDSSKASEDELLTQIETGISDVEQIASKEQQIADLQVEEQSLKTKIASLQANYSSISEQLSQTQNAMSVVVQESLAHLEQRKQTLQIAIEQLERRSERIRADSFTYGLARGNNAVKLCFLAYLGTSGDRLDLAISAPKRSRNAP